MSLYTVLSPIKYKGELIKSGDVDMPEKLAARLVESGELAPAGTAAKPKGK